MYRSALRSSPRIANHLRQSAARAGGRRFASTAPADKPRSWKSSAVRWGIAIGAVYYYNNSTAFAEEPPCRCSTIPHTHLPMSLFWSVLSTPDDMS